MTEREILRQTDRQTGRQRQYTTGEDTDAQPETQTPAEDGGGRGRRNA